jgi:hypothetical protein
MMRTAAAGVAIGAMALAGGVWAATRGGAASPVPTRVSLVAASSAVAAADQAALTYVGQNYPGAGTAKVLKTESDTERGVPVYDVVVQAPNGATYSVSVRASDDSVLAAHLTESSPAPLGTLTGPSPTPAETPEPSRTPEPTDTPDAQQTPESHQTPEATATPASSGSSPDQNSSGGDSGQSPQPSDG